ncbi:hypothetical protein DBL07_13675 [Achromobacter mucicolens]|nr:hypothetical protein DBL07_13675 [Achromobacter mucicolens]
MHESPESDDWLAIHEEYEAVIRVVQDPFQQLAQQGGVVAAALRLNGFAQLRHTCPDRFELAQCPGLLGVSRRVPRDNGSRAGRIPIYASAVFTGLRHGETGEQIGAFAFQYRQDLTSHKMDSLPALAQNIELINVFAT